MLLTELFIDSVFLLNAVSRHSCLHLMPYWSCFAVSIQSPVAAILQKPIQCSILHTLYRGDSQWTSSMPQWPCFVAKLQCSLQNTYFYNSMYLYEYYATEHSGWTRTRQDLCKDHRFNNTLLPSPPYALYSGLSSCCPVLSLLCYSGET